jgi:3-oxoacyl-[acyl-carrier-protein] synthase-3
MFLPVRIWGTGTVLPAQCVTAEELDARLDLPPGTTLSRNGVRTRFFACEEETSSAMSAAAIREALEAAGLDTGALDAILFSAVMSEQPLPSTAVRIHQRLEGVRNDVVCFDVNASCAGFFKLLELAAHGIHAGSWRCVAIVAAEIASKGLNWSDLDTCTLFGDGAAAAILGPAADGEVAGIVAARHVTISEGFDLSSMRAGGSRYNVRTPPPRHDDYLFAMNGRGLLRLTDSHLPQFVDALMNDAGDELSLIVPHQASSIGLAYLRRLRDAHLPRPGGEPIPIVEILPEFGNQVSASMPTALDRAIRSGMLQRGQTALLIGTAAGLALCGIVLRY